MEQAILEQARRLGKEIAGSPQARKLRQARRTLDQHEDVKKLLEEFQAQSEKVGRLESENKPVEVEDKHKLQDLHDRLVGSEVFKQFTAAQVDYIDLMRKVNQALGEQLGEVEEAPDGSSTATTQ